MSDVDAVLGVPAVEPGTAGPPCAYARLRDEKPVVRTRLPNGETGWLISRYADVRAAFADPRLERPLLSAWPRSDDDDEPPPCLPTFLEMTGEHHERVRRAVLPLFGRRRLEFMGPRIRAMAEELIDTMVAGAADGTADLVAFYVEPLPLRVLCETTGLPHEDRDIYLPHTLTLLGASGLSKAEVLAALNALQDYASALVSRKEQAGFVELLLAQSRCPGSDLTRDDVVSFVVTMIMAGFKTTMQHTGNALLALLTHPGELRRLREEPAGIGTAVEELLRYVPLMNAINILVAKEDFTLHDQHIRVGDAVVPVPASANRDPGAFADPDRLDLTRSPNAHIAFGHGPHMCTGGHLTRLQLATTIQVLVERLPGIELAVPVDSIPWDESTPLRAPARLPVRW
ncbi:cytochrome P450 [Nocardia sp. NPDC058480]|uniref:cytochrome P450 family protein n=1 Tax=Nocardia sp. NPDC058480 TaxID=3346522 RepID=UPI00364E79EF